MSGRLVGGVVGAVIGGYFGNAQLGWMIGSAVGGYVDPDVVQGPRLTDAGQQFSQDGVALTWGFGTFPTSGNVIWRQVTIDEVRHKESSKGGPVQVTYTYHRSYAIGVCQGPIDGFLQIKRNGKIVFDARPDAELLALGYDVATIKEIRAATAKFLDKCRMYLGDETQLPDPVIESFEGVGNVAPFHGLAYITVEADDLTESAGAIPQYEFVVVYNGEVGSSAGQYKALQYSGDILPWIEDAHLFRDPRKVGVDYEYGYLPRGLGYSSAIWGFSSVIDTLDAAIDAGDTNSRSYAGDPQLRGWRTFSHIVTDGSTHPIYPWAGTAYDANTQSALGLIYSRYPAEIEHDGTTDILSGSNSCPTFHEAVWSYDIDAGASGNLTAVYIRDPYNDLDAGVDDGFVNCYLDGVLNGTGVSGGPGSVRQYVDFVVLCRPVLACNTDIPLEWIPVPDAPGTFVDQEGELHFQEICEPAVGTFKQLAAFETTSGSNPTFLSVPQGPTLAPGDVDYNNESFWTYSYEEAVDLGTMPAGKSYGIDYPVMVTGACHCVPATPTLARDRIVLAEVVAEICRRAGLEEDDYDVSQLTDILDGYRIASEGNGEAFIAPLMPAYFFDSTEYDGKLRFIKRGGDPVATITVDDLVERDGDAVEWERIQEPELLRKQTVAYLSPRAGFTRMTQQAERRSVTVQAIGEATVEIPVVMSDDDAAQVAEKRIKVAYTEPEKCYYSLSYKFSYLTPCDVVWFNDGERTRRVRLSRDDTDTGVSLIEASMDRQSAYVSNAKGTATNPPIIVTPGIIGPTNAVIMNLPLLRETDDEAGLYVAMAGYLNGWEGAELLFSTDDGATYQSAATITSKAVIGYTLTALLAEVSSEYLSQQSVTVYLPEAPESLSYEAMLRYGNRAIIGGEILQYQTVTTVDETTFILSGLLRGRHNTLPVEHAAGASFVLFDEAVQFVPTPSWMIGRALKYKAVSLGTSADSYVGLDYTYSPCISQTEFSPTFVRATRDGSSNVLVTWIGRGRIGAEVAPRQSKYFIGYRVSWDDGTTLTTADTTSNSYTIASAANPIVVSVQALNIITGAGAASEEITV